MFFVYIAPNMTHISEEDEDYEDIRLTHMMRKQWRKSHQYNYQTIFDSKMTNPVCSWVPADEFGDYVARCHSNQNKDFKAQFAVWATMKFKKKFMNHFGNCVH